jgi:hypothetical protein
VGFRASLISGQADVMQLPIVKLEQAFSLMPALQGPMRRRGDAVEPSRDPRCFDLTRCVGLRDR